MATEVLHGGKNKYNAVYEKSTPELYDEWAKDGYEETVGAVSVAVRSVASVLARRLVRGGQQQTVLDAGCGTGSVVDACRDVLENRPMSFDGLDFSAGMLEVAKKKATYRKLMQADLTKPLDSLEDGTYTAVVSSGTFLQGHVGPEALPELCRVLAPGGVMAFSVRPTFFEETRMQWLSTLEANGMQDVSIDMLPYSRGPDGTTMLAPVVSCRKAAGCSPTTTRPTVFFSLLAVGAAIGAAILVGLRPGHL